MIEKIVDRLVSIKSIVTLVLTAVFAYLSIIGVISGENFLSVFLIIIGFYFGSQVEKRAKEQEAQETKAALALPEQKTNE